MKRLFPILIVACASGGAPKPVTEPVASPPVPSGPAAAESPQRRVEHLTADSPRMTSGGTSFVAPAGWSVVSRDNVVVLDPPEADSHIVFVDVTAGDADQAVAAAW